MAAADYYLCDVCECKTFYDANVDYDDWYRTGNSNPVTHRAWPNGNVGHMVVICKDCATMYRVELVKKPDQGEGAG